MHWIQPAYLWLAAALLPLILFFYLLKRKYQDQIISSTLLWDQVLEKMEANRPWQKLWRHLLLWLQLLAVILFILGLSRPALPTDGLKASHTILLIDVSGSMQAMEGNSTRLEHAKAKARGWIDEMNSDQMITLIEAGSAPRVLIAQSKDSHALKQALKQVKGQVGASDLPAALTLSHALASKSSSAEIILLGDGANVQELTLSPHRFIQVGKGSENISVGSFTASSKGKQIAAFARLDHHGKQDAQVIVTLKNDKGQLLDTRSVELKANKSQVIQWDDLPQSAYYQVQISSPDDALPLDNQRWAFPEQAGRVQTLLVGKENLFLSKALQLSRSLEVIRADHISEQQKEVPIVVLNKSTDKIPAQKHLFILDPARSQSLVPVSGLTKVSGEVTVDANHPIMQSVNIKQVNAVDVKKVQAPDWAKVLLKVEDTPLILAGEHQGRRVVILTFDLQKSDLPLQPSFPILMVQVMKWLSPAPEASGITAEARKEMKVNLPAFAQKVKIKSLSSSIEEERVVEGGVFTYQVPEQSGLYMITSPDHQQVLQYITVPFPQEESTITPQAVSTTASTAGNVSISGVEELWWWFALMGLAVIGVEWMVFSRGY